MESDVSTSSVGGNQREASGNATHGSTRAPLAVVLVTFNSAKILKEALDSLPAGLQGVVSCEVIVVDNASRDRSIEIALGHSIRPRVISMGRNAGYAAAINAATATIAREAAVLVLNPDVRLLPGMALLLMDEIAKPLVAIAAPMTFSEDGRLSWSLRREPSLMTAWAEALLGGSTAAKLGVGEIITYSDAYRESRKIDWASGAVLAISPGARQAVGDWDERYFLYSEEVDYCRRARELGFNVKYVAEAKAIHIGGECHQDSQLFALLTANRVRYYRRYHGMIPSMMFWTGVAVGEKLRAALGRKHGGRG